MVAQLYVQRIGKWIMEDDMPNAELGVGKSGKIHRLIFPTIGQQSSSAPGMNRLLLDIRSMQGA